MMERQLNLTNQDVALKLAEILTQYLTDNPGNTNLADLALTKDGISPATNMVTDLQLDSFQVMEFMLEVEDHFDVAIDLVSLSNIHTISDLAGVVVAAQAA